MDFESVYRAHYQAVYRFLLSMCRNHALAEELAQETFIRAMNHWRDYRGQCAPQTWLISIAKNAYFSHRRREKRLLPGDQDPAMFDFPEADMEKRELIEQAHRALHALPEPYREVFSLRTFAELSHAQIAALFGKGEAWSRVTYYRARVMLQEAMKEGDRGE